MKISHVVIQNFRKLKASRIEFAEEQTVFVGANNSGKTSAMDALILFLKKNKQSEISTTDFTLSNWSDINEIGTQWASIEDKDDLNLTLDQWRPHLPTLDLWIDVDDSEVHYVSHLIPTLDWDGGLLGVRLTLEPKDIETLYKEFVDSYSKASSTLQAHNEANANKDGSSLSLWPQSMREFLDKTLPKLFTVNAYLLDPTFLETDKAQVLSNDAFPIAGNPFSGLFKIDIINAQRGFSDANTGEGVTGSPRGLTSQFRSYFNEHLNPSELPEAGDLDALEAISNAKVTFDQKLEISFKPAIKELEDLNYPGFDNPQIKLSSNVNPIEGLDHDTAVQFKVPSHEGTPGAEGLRLPEKHNGLGYQNLISMVFNLIRFRDEWLCKGKAQKRIAGSDTIIEPLHLVLIEEPEAHLHAQVQQVFIKKVYSVLRKSVPKNLSTQMVVSTHSSHIAHEIDFTALRYFRRHPLNTHCCIPSVTVVNLQDIFGEESATSRFAARYLKSTHCDLFFADAAILVEGPAEKMLVPHFIRRKEHDQLDRSYITTLEIGGSHAHKLKPLIEALGLLTLVITDLDSLKEEAKLDEDGTPKVGEDGTSMTSSKKTPPERGSGYHIGNDAVQTWINKGKDLDSYLDIKSEQKQSEDGNVRIAYQCPINVKFEDTTEEVIPYTFEDALVLGNVEVFRGLKDTTALLKKMVTAVNLSNPKAAAKDMFTALERGKKAEMALELLFRVEPQKLVPPQYITEGFTWLKEKLELTTKNTTSSPATEDAP